MPDQIPCSKCGNMVPAESAVKPSELIRPMNFCPQCAATSIDVLATAVRSVEHAAARNEEKLIAEIDRLNEQIEIMEITYGV